MAVAGGRTLRVALVANTTSFRKGMMSAVRDAQGFQGKMSALATSVGRFAGPALAGAAAAVGAFAIKLGVDGVKAAMEEERALVQLETALGNVGQAFASVQVNQFIDDLQFMSGVADDELRPAYTRLVTATRDAAEAQDLLNLALDISAGTGRDLESVTTALSKAALGQTTALRRLGVPLDAATLKSGDLNAITEELAKTFDGQAEAAANTFQGRLKRLQVAASELQEAFGTGVLGALEESAGGAENLTVQLRSLQDEAENLGQNVGEGITLFIDLASTLGDARDSVNDLIADGGALGGTLGVLTREAGRLLNPVGFLIDHVKILSAAFTGNDDAMQAALGATTQEAKKTGAALSTMVEDVVDAADEAEKAAQEFDLFADAISRTNAVMAYQEALDDLKGSLKDNGKAVSIFTNKGRENVDALIGVAEAAKTAMESTDSQAQKALYASSALDTLTTTMANTKMDEGTKAALLAPFQALLDDLQENGVNVDSLQRKLDALNSKTITVTTRFVTLGDGSYFGSGDAAGGGGAGGSGGGGGGGGRTRTRSASPVSVGTLIVNSAPGERAEESVPRSLRRLAFVAGLGV